MNLGVAIEVITYALELEKAGRIQDRLQEVLNAIGGMASNPQDPSQQTALASNLEALDVSISKVTADLSPAEHERLRLLGARNFFDRSLYEQIVASVNSNPTTPAVARDFIQEIVNSRNGLLDDLRATKALSERLAWATDVNHDKIAELGFTIPRNIFENRFDNFIKELEFLKRFVSSVYETLGEDGSDIEVSSLSTTDPLILLGVSFFVAKRVGQTVTWALSSWKSVEEIREIRSRAAGLKSFSEAEIGKIFDGKIKDQISAEIKAEAARLVSGMKEKERKNELESAFNIYLRQLLERIERGMTVEIRLLQAPEGKEDATEEEKAAFSSISETLSFPKPSGDPVLALTDGSDAQSASKTKPPSDSDGET
ncbi:hypothetical protein U1839_19245 [Sphingomonas sp. RT2P30]|uniref:hypothetical protein n=1 Tax=Parasphingomonas halimpatiens TaxID=3096162 RepID=UPI002FC8439E